MSFDSGPIHEVHELVDVAAAIGVKVGIVGVLVDVESEDGSDPPHWIAVLGVPNVVKQLFRAVIVPGPGPTTGGDPGRLQIFLIVVEGSEILIDMFENTIRRLSISAQDGEVEFVVFEATDGKGEVYLQRADSGKDLIGHRGVGRIWSAHFF